MKSIKDHNNIFYLNGFDEVPDWVTESPSDGKKYFPLNCVTRDLFKRDLLPYCLNGEIDISREDKFKIRDFVQNPTRELPAKRVIPKGIELKKHQVDAIEYICNYDRFALFYGTGTGKTLIAICAILTHDPKSVLIVTPKKVISQYENQINTHIGSLNSLHIKITNFESLNSEEPGYEMIIVDEAHKAKNFMSEANKNLRVLAKDARYVYLFTGTPKDRGRHEILPQLAILDQRVMPVKGRIYDRYFHINDYFNPDKELRQFSAELTKVIKCYSYGVQTEDALPDLPPENDIKLMCPHPPEYYDQLRDDRVVKTPAGIAVCENKGTLRMKLREICAGFLNVERQEPDGYDYDIIDGVEIKIPRYKIVKEMVRLTPTKVPLLKTAMMQASHCIVFTEFQNDIDIVRMAAYDVGKLSYTLKGGTSKKIKLENDQAIDAWKRKQIDVLILNSKSGSAGLDLFQSNTIIFYSLPESFILFSQAKARIRRYGQTADKCNYVYLICQDSVEEQQYSALLKKKNFDNKTFKVYKRR